MTDDSRSWHVDTPIVLVHFMAGDAKGVEEAMGNESFIFSGPEPEGAAAAALNEAGKGILPLRGHERSHRETDGDLLPDRG